MSEPTKQSFGHDLGLALRAWRRFPWLPVVSVALTVAVLPEPAWLVLLPAVLSAGWVGTERIAYLRAFRGKSLEAWELWKLTRAFVIRYLVLGIVAFFPIALVLYGVSAAQPLESFAGGRLIALYGLTSLVDMLLTFVTPALAFSTRRVRTALVIGLRMIRSAWPSSAWYVLVPPLALRVVCETLFRTTNVSTSNEIVLAALATLLNLWFKGATAAFYLRHHHVGDNGSAFLTRAEEDGIQKDL